MPENPRIEELRRRVLADPASIAFAALAEEFRRVGAFTEAIETCRTGLERHPAYLSARVTLGRALIEVGDLEGAKEELETVLRSAPENLAAIRGLAQIHENLGRSTEMDPHLAELMRQEVVRVTTPPEPIPVPVAEALPPEPAPEPELALRDPRVPGEPEPEPVLRDPRIPRQPEPEPVLRDPRVPRQPEPEPVLRDPRIPRQPEPEPVLRDPRIPRQPEPEPAPVLAIEWEAEPEPALPPEPVIAIDLEPEPESATVFAIEPEPEPESEPEFDPVMVLHPVNPGPDAAMLATLGRLERFLTAIQTARHA